jgi:hypothetical protein
MNQPGQGERTLLLLLFALLVVIIASFVWYRWHPSCTTMPSHSVANALTARFTPTVARLSQTGTTCPVEWYADELPSRIPLTVSSTRNGILTL